MLRYQRLLKDALDPEAKQPLSMRDLARKIGIPIPTMHTYVVDGTLPRIDNAEKIAKYFGESISSMFSDDDEITARLVAAIRKLSDEQKKALLQQLR